MQIRPVVAKLRLWRSPTNANALGVKTIDGCILLALLTGRRESQARYSIGIFGGTFITCRARAIVLATGGAGEVFRINYCSNVATGDGYAAAYRAGADLVGMEFTQFSPHTMMEPGLPMWYLLPCEARLHSAYRNVRGERFLDGILTKTADTANFQKRHGELSTDVREIISRAIATEIFEGRGDGNSIWLDFREVPEELWEADLPSRYNLRCLIRGFDWKNKPIRISPGALTHLGGIAIDSWGRTNLHRLYAIGEAAAPLHGARRRGGNAFSGMRRVWCSRGSRGGRARARWRARTAAIRSLRNRGADAQIASWHRSATPDGDPADIRKYIQTTMWQNAGPLRTKERLEQCLQDLRGAGERLLGMHARTPFEVKAAVEVEYMLEMAELIARCAQFRTESRGAHFRADFPTSTIRIGFANRSAVTALRRSGVKSKPRGSRSRIRSRQMELSRPA